jgi:hypothetical protein
MSIELISTGSSISASGPIHGNRKKKAENSIAGCGGGCG